SVHGWSTSANWASACATGSHRWTRTSSRLPSCATSWPPSSPRNWGAVMLLDDYAQVAGEDVIEHLRQLARPLAGKRLVNVNSTREGGGVAEILRKLVP